MKKQKKKNKLNILKYEDYISELKKYNFNETYKLYEEYSKNSKFRSFKNFLKHKAKETKAVSKNIIHAFKQEGNETKNMMLVFNRHLRKKLNLKNRKDTPSPEELKEALTQLKDIPKLLPFAAVMLAAPIPGTTALYTVFAYYLNKKTDGKINILPDSFEDVLNIENNK